MGPCFPRPIELLWENSREMPLPTPQTPEAKTSTEKSRLIENILQLEMPMQVVAENIEAAIKTAVTTREVPPSPVTTPIRARRLALQTMPLEELKALHAKATAQKARQDEAQRFYNKPDARVDYSFWLSMDFWTLDEAMAILCQRDPRVVNRAKIESDLAPKKGVFSGQANPPTAFTKAFLALSQLAERSNAMTHSPRLTPAKVIRWAKGAIGQSVPAPLLAYLEQQSALLPPAEPAPEPSAPVPATTAPDELRKTKVKRAVLLAMSDRWKTVESDFQHAKENGLDAAAKAPGHGMWWREAALDWASRHRELRPEPSSTPLKSSVFHMST